MSPPVELPFPDFGAPSEIPLNVLVAEDPTGSGHKWRLINDEPWKRAQVVFKEGANTQFVPEAAASTAEAGRSAAGTS